jgi:hypothetical protein
MRITVEGIIKEERLIFKKMLFEVEARVNVYSDGTTCAIDYTEPYTKTEEDLKIKSEVKKNIYKHINNFRQYQFNQMKTINNTPNKQAR